MYSIDDASFSVADVSPVFSGSGCTTVQQAERVYLGKLAQGIGLLTALVRDYGRCDAEDFASEYISRHLSDLNHMLGIGRYTIFGAELKTDRKTYRDCVAPHLISDALRRRAGDFYVTSDHSRIDGISGLKGITLYEMRHACDVAGADLRNGDLVVVTTSWEAIERLGENLKERLLM